MKDQSAEEMDQGEEENQSDWRHHRSPSWKAVCFVLQCRLLGAVQGRVEEELSAAAAHTHQTDRCPKGSADPVLFFSPSGETLLLPLCSRLCLAEISFSSTSFPGALEAGLPGEEM